MLLNTCLVLAVLTTVFAVIIARRPDRFQVTRRAVVDAPPTAAFVLVNNLREHDRWSPFMQTDPVMQCNYAGPELGIGSSLHWRGDRRAGEGRVTIIDSRPDERVGFRLEFLRPFKATNAAEITFEEQADGGTLVTWSMSGTSSFLCKAIGLFVDCDAMVGREFEKGLAQLKTLSEADAEPSLAAAH